MVREKGAQEGEKGDWQTHWRRGRKERFFMAFDEKKKNWCPPVFGGFWRKGTDLT